MSTLYTTETEKKRSAQRDFCFGSGKRLFFGTGCSESGNEYS